MRVAIAGGHGKVARHLTRLLSQRGDEVRSIIRKPDEEQDVREAGAEPAVCDLENATEAELAEAVGRVDAVVFAAGAGPGSGPERKWTVDWAGAVKLIEAAKIREVPRYIMLSSVGADPDAPGDDTFAEYRRAKGRADADLMASGLDYTIVRPVSLTDEPGKGTVTLGEHVERGKISRQDVAAVLDAVLHEPALGGRVFEATSGDTPIEDAIQEMVDLPKPVHQ